MAVAMRYPRMPKELQPTQFQNQYQESLPDHNPPSPSKDMIKKWQLPGTSYSATYVCMPKPGASERHPFRIRKAAPDDAEAIAELGAATFSESFGFSIPPRDLQAYLDSSYTAKAMAEEIQDPKKYIIVACAETSGEVLGFAQLTQDTHEPCTIHLPRTVELQRLYTKIGYQGSGIGRALTDHVETTAWDMGFRNIWLGVWEGNFRAQKCYEAMGYEKIGDHEFRMGSCIQMDWIMNKTLRQ